MPAFIETFFAFANPNILPAIASAAAASWLVGWLRGSGPVPQSPVAIIMAVGTAVVIVLALSASAAILGLKPSTPSESFGIIAGTVAGVLLAPKRA